MKPAYYRPLSGVIYLQVNRAFPTCSAIYGHARSRTHLHTHMGTVTRRERYKKTLMDISSINARPNVSANIYNNNGSNTNLYLEDMAL